MKNTLYFLLSMALLVSCQSKIEGEGMANVEHTFGVDLFEELSINCHCDVTLIPSEDTKVVVESHQNLIDNLELNQKKNRLDIQETQSVEKASLYNVNVYHSSDLKKITLQGAAHLKTSGTLKAETMDIQLNGSSHLTQTFSEIKNLNLHLKDESKLEMTGTAIDLKIEAEDASHGDLSQLQAVDVVFKSKNKSNLSIYAMKSLEGKASDQAQVFYSGNPNKNTTEKDQAVIQQK